MSLYIAGPRTSLTSYDMKHNSHYGEPMSFRQLLERSELEPFLLKSDAKGAWYVLVNWGLVVFAFTLPILWWNPLTILLSIILLGNRQLGLGILMHDCSHAALFKTRSLNQWVGKWLCAAPILADIDGYRRYHLKHHKEAGTTNDPDYPNYKNYPVTPSSFKRKVLRDLSGVTGVKTIYAILLMQAGVIDYDMSYQKSDHKSLNSFEIARNLFKNLTPSLLIHLVIWLVLVSVGHGTMYLLWWVALLTVNMLFSRIRNSAEHANVPDLLNEDPRLHARTTYASWWERLTFAPNHVNYHLEHHWMPTVPPYQLPAFHQYLKNKGVLDGAEVLNGYGSVMKRMMGLSL